MDCKQRSYVDPYKTLNKKDSLYKSQKIRELTAFYLILKFAVYMG